MEVVISKACKGAGTLPSALPSSRFFPYPSSHLPQLISLNAWVFSYVVTLLCFLTITNKSKVLGFVEGVHFSRPYLHGKFAFSIHLWKSPQVQKRTCIKYPSIRASKNLVNYFANLLKMNKTINNGWDCMWIIALFVNPQEVSPHTSIHTKIMKTYNHENVKIHNYFWVSKIAIRSIPDLVKNYACVHAWTNMFHIDKSSVKFNSFFTLQTTLSLHYQDMKLMSILVTKSHHHFILDALTRTKVQQFFHSPDNTFAALSRYETHEHLGYKISPPFQMFFAKLRCLPQSSSHKQIL
jgi:hypothetical protein